jgi:hypothetical protein
MFLMLLTGTVNGFPDRMVDHLNSGAGSPLQEGHVGSVRESLLGSGDAGRRIEHLPFSAPLFLFLVGWLRQGRVDG